jgi:hypothetical protein
MVGKMPKVIKLSSGDSCIVDDEDYPILSLFKWHMKNGRNTKYASLGRFNHEEEAAMAYMEAANAL